MSATFPCGPPGNDNDDTGPSEDTYSLLADNSSCQDDQIQSYESNDDNMSQTTDSTLDFDHGESEDGM
jgi:hypothetical protein